MDNELKIRIIDLYRSGKNCVEIKKELNLKGHQQVLNVLHKIDDYIPYRNGRGAIRSYTLKETYFQNIDTEAKAYILGFICADGHVDTTRNALTFTVATKDKDLLEKIRIELGSNQIIRDFERKTNFNYGKPIFYHSKIEFCSKILVQTLTSKGLNKNKTYTLNSTIIDYVPENLKFHFLRGYFDGDGNVVWNRCYSSGCKYNINICGNLEFLQNTFNKYFPTINKFYKDLYSKQCWIYKISSKERTFQFLRYLYEYSTIYLNRKYEVYKIACGHLKQDELLETPTLERQKEDNQQPSLSSNTFEGSTTNSQIQSDSAEDSNGNTSVLPGINCSIFKIILKKEYFNNSDDIV